MLNPHNFSICIVRHHSCQLQSMFSRHLLRLTGDLSGSSTHGDYVKSIIHASGHQPCNNTGKTWVYSQTWEAAVSCMCVSFTFLVPKILLWWLSEKLYVHSCVYVWKDNSRFQQLSASQHSLETREGSCRSASSSTHTIIRCTFINWNISCSVPFLINVCLLSELLFSVFLLNNSN